LRPGSLAFDEVADRQLSVLRSNAQTTAHIRDAPTFGAADPEG
jgi:hypothetical protein